MVQITGSGPVLKIFTKKWFSDNVTLLCSENEKTSSSFFFFKSHL